MHQMIVTVRFYTKSVPILSYVKAAELKAKSDSFHIVSLAFKSFKMLKII